MNRTSKRSIGGPPVFAALILATCIVAAGGLLWPAASARAADRSGQYCDAERGNACNDHEPSDLGSSPRGSPATDPATPGEPTAPADPEPTPETPT